MTQDDHVTSLQHFGGFHTHLLLDYLVTELGERGAREVLESAGEQRPHELLRDDSSWSSYWQFRSLLEAAAARVGEAGLRSVGPSTEMISWGAETALTIQGLESVEALLIESGASGTSLGMSTISVSKGVEKLEDGILVAGTAFREGFEPFKEFCWYAQGLLAMAPRLFGLPPGTVSELECQCDGAPACRHLIELNRPSSEQSSLRHELDAANRRLAFYQTRLESIQASLVDLVSTSDIGLTLSRIARSAAKTVRAPGWLLHLPGQRVVPRLVSSAADIDAPSVIERVAVGLDGQLAIPVESDVMRYGSIILIEQGRSFRPFEEEAVASYGRLAAAALDSASALGEARRQAHTATALLELSADLGAVFTQSDAADRLARAVPRVLDCDRSLVVLVDDSGRAHVSACHGYPPDLAQTLIGTPLDPVGIVDDTLSFVELNSAAPSSATARLMSATGSVGAVSLPIRIDGQCVGIIVAAVVEGPGRLASSPELEERLRGLAGQAATAIRNSRLVDEIRHQALHDPLTGLPNRALIADRAEHLLKHARRHANHVAVMFVDLDGFKDVNDTFGHGAGDELLQLVADRLSRTVRDCDTVGRIGGDEFIILLEGSPAEGGPAHIGERILRALREPFHPAACPESLIVTGSIGLALGCSSPEELSRNADIALYQAKGGGRNRMVIYDPQMGLLVHERRKLQADLEHALERGEFSMVYQPVFSLPDIELIGVEALLRWKHPERGLVGPDEFIPVLESNGLIIEVGRFVLEQACSQAVIWQGQGRTLDMSVNVSAVQLESGAFLDELTEVLERTGLPPQTLIIEITETALMHDLALSAARLKEIRAMGVRVAIDDFGREYSSMSYLRQLPVDVLKIDRSFVSAMADSPQATAIVHSFVELGRTLGLKTLAEGIEDDAQLLELSAQACDAGQGFLLAKPVAAAKIQALLAASAADRRPDFVPVTAS